MNLSLFCSLQRIDFETFLYNVVLTCLTYSYIFYFIDH